MYQKIIHFINKYWNAINDVIISLFPQIITILLGLVTSTIIARTLGPDGMGKYALIISFSTIIIGFSEFGINQVGIRYASYFASQNDPDNQYRLIRWVLNIRIILGSICIGVGFLLAYQVASFFWHDPSLTPALRLSLVLVLLNIFCTISQIYFLSIKYFKLNSTLSMISPILSLIGILIVTFFNAISIISLLIILILSNTIQGIIYWFFLPKALFSQKQSRILSIKKIIDLNVRKPLLGIITTESNINSEIKKFTGYYAISGITQSLIAQTDLWLMGFFLAKDQVGIFSIALFFSLPLQMLVSSIHTALWPRVSGALANNSTKNLLKTAMELSVITSLGAILYGIFVPIIFLPLLFGNAYASGIVIAQILCIKYSISIFFKPITLIGYNYGIVPTIWKINIFQLILQISLDIILLPIIGILGAAIVTTIVQFFGDLSTGIIILRNIPKDKQ